MNLTEFSPILQQQQESGNSQKSFCAERGIPYSTFQYWVKRHKESSQAKKQFVELAIPGSIHSSGEILFPNSVSIRLPSGFKMTQDLLTMLKGL